MFEMESFNISAESSTSHARYDDRRNTYIYLAIEDEEEEEDGMIIEHTNCL